LVTSSGFIFRLLVLGQITLLVRAGSGSDLIPAWPLALGTLSRSSKLFEICYLLIWYAVDESNCGTPISIGVPRDRE